MLLRLVADGILLAVRVKPHSRLSKVALQIDAAGQPVLMVPVTAPPERGKANAAVCAFLAQALGLPKSTITVQSGMTNPHKQILLRGDGDKLLPRVQAWLNGLDD